MLEAREVALDLLRREAGLARLEEVGVVVVGGFRVAPVPLVPGNDKTFLVRICLIELPA